MLLKLFLFLSVALIVNVSIDPSLTDSLSGVYLSTTSIVDDLLPLIGNVAECIVLHVIKGFNNIYMGLKAFWSGVYLSTTILVDNLPRLIGSVTEHLFIHGFNVFNMGNVAERIVIKVYNIFGMNYCSRLVDMYSSDILLLENTMNDIRQKNTRSETHTCLDIRTRSVTPSKMLELEERMGRIRFMYSRMQSNIYRDYCSRFDSSFDKLIHGLKEDIIRIPTMMETRRICRESEYLHLIILENPVDFAESEYLDLFILENPEDFAESEYSPLFILENPEDFAAMKIFFFGVPLTIDRSNSHDNDSAARFSDNDLAARFSDNDLAARFGIGVFFQKGTMSDTWVSSRKYKFPVRLYSDTSRDHWEVRSDVKCPVSVYLELNYQTSMKSLSGFESAALLATLIIAARLMRSFREGKVLNGSYSNIVKVCIKEARYQSSTKIEAVRHCGLCINHNQAIAYCKTCKLYICMPCNNFHKRVWTFMNHNVCPFNKL